MQIERVAVERRLVDLEVAGVQDRANRRVDRQRQAIRHAVRDAEKLDSKRAGPNRLSWRDRAQPAARVDAMLLELRLDERERETRAVDGTGHAVDDVRDCAAGVLVEIG